MVERRVKFLTDYQDAAYAKPYADLVARVRTTESRVMPGSTALAEAVARYDFKLRAIKDEYEVARLYAESDFAERVAKQFEGDYKLVYHLAPPTTNKVDPTTGEPRKSTYGPWMMKGSACSRSCAVSAGPRSTSSAERKSARWSAGSSPTTRR
jgi:indolepyruvate ferredoxin oxidoreductase